MIYFSTGVYPKLSGVQAAEMFVGYGIKTIELSGGKYESEMLKKLEALKRRYELKFQIHNYFPVPEKPFVFNLASRDKDIVTLSLNHARNAIEAANFLGSEYYSFHAGFLFDPSPQELGSAMKKKPLTDRLLGLSAFVENVGHLAEFARKHGITLLIENNVISKRNYEYFSANPLLMTESTECKEIMEATPSNVQLLVDVGHVKVSACTMNFDPVSFLRETSAWTMAYHLSDNNGEEDRNESLTNASWFWPHLNRELNYFSLEFSVCSRKASDKQLELFEQKQKVDS